MKKRNAFTYAVLFGACMIAELAVAAPISFTKLSGITGGAIAGTAVYKADLSSLGVANIQSITIQDNSGGLGGAVGQFTGFDLDAIKLSTSDCSDAACAASAASLAVFDFASGTFFTPGSQRAPVDTKLFGTGPTGSTVDNAWATLSLFDGESTTAIPGAFGFVSMGDNGILSVNLTSLLSTTGVYLYIGEVGDNGEVAASNVSVSENRVPEPASLALAGLGLAGLGLTRRRKAAKTS